MWIDIGHGSYEWIIMREKCRRPDSNGFQLKWRFGTHGNWKNQNKNSTLNWSFYALSKWHEPDIKNKFFVGRVRETNAEFQMHCFLRPTCRNQCTISTRVYYFAQKWKCPSLGWLAQVKTFWLKKHSAWTYHYYLGLIHNNLEWNIIGRALMKMHLCAVARHFCLWHYWQSPPLFS